MGKIRGRSGRTGGGAKEDASREELKGEALSKRERLWKTVAMGM